MSPLTIPAKRFCDSYQKRRPQFVKAAEIAERLVLATLSDRNLDLHLVSGRAKSHVSVLAKTRHKHYGAPAMQMTDVVGVRVITYYQSDVDKAVKALRDKLEIHGAKSIDKRTQLDIHEFGYRSVHLIARLTSSQASQPHHGVLGRMWFEIQVRSLLEHAWAEIEHEIRYKSGIVYAADVNRMFGAVAGALEILERQFLELRAERKRLIKEYRRHYSEGLDDDVMLDSARLLGALEVYRPHGLTWIKAEEEGAPFPPRIEAVCVEALAAGGVTTAKELRELLDAQQFKSKLHSFASLNGLTPDEVSHLAVTAIAVGTLDPDLLFDEYPELVTDRTLEGLFVPSK